jgi:hypothetical protein
MSRSLSRQVSDSPSPQFQQSPGTRGRLRDSNRSGSSQGLSLESSSRSILPSREVIVATAGVYLLYCDCQPLPLFHRGSFIQTLENRDKELILAILALTFRFSNDPALNVYEVDEFVEASRAAVMRRVYDGTVELSTLQALCLLSLVDFTSMNATLLNIVILIIE